MRAAVLSSALASLTCGRTTNMIHPRLHGHPLVSVCVCTLLWHAACRRHMPESLQPLLFRGDRRLGKPSVPRLTLHFYGCAGIPAAAVIGAFRCQNKGAAAFLLHYFRRPEPELAQSPAGTTAFTRDNRAPCLSPPTNEIPSRDHHGAVEGG